MSNDSKMIWWLLHPLPSAAVLVRRQACILTAKLQHWPSDVCNASLQAIIGTIGDVDAYQLPDAKGHTAMMRHILGVSDAERQQRREEILGTTIHDFR